MWVSTGWLSKALLQGENGSGDDHTEEQPFASCSSQPDVTTKYTGHHWLFWDFIHTPPRKHEELQMTEGIEINAISLLLGPV